MTLKTLNDLIVSNLNPDISCARAVLMEELREAAKEWLNVFKNNREVDQDPEEGIDEAFIKIFFNLVDENK